MTSLPFALKTGITPPDVNRGAEPHAFSKMWEAVVPGASFDIPDTYWEKRGEGDLTFAAKKSRIHNNFNNWRAKKGVGTPQYDLNILCLQIEEGESYNGGTAEFDGIRCFFWETKGRQPHAGFKKAEDDAEPGEQTEPEEQETPEPTPAPAASTKPKTRKASPKKGAK